jgi:tetratricopeptide (TPR) repeat protein
VRALSLSTVVVLALFVSSPETFAQAGTGVSTQRSAPVMRQDIYRELRSARECAADGDFACAEQQISDVFARADLNSYERAQAWNVAARLEADRDDTEAAISAYRNMLAEQDVPLGLVRSARYSLAVLYTRIERFDDALASLDDWWSIASPSAPEPFVLRAQIQFQRGQYDASIAAIDEVLALAAARGIDESESWYQIRAASLQATGDLDAAAGVLESILERWPARRYYVQLAGIYSQLGNDRRKYELYEDAYAAGWLVSGVDLIALAGFRIEAGRLEDAVNVLEQNRDRGYLPDGDSLRVLIARSRDWLHGARIVDEEFRTLLRNARLEQQAADRPQRLRL